MIIFCICRCFVYTYYILGILMQQQELLKQKLQDEQQQQPSIVTLTPECVAQFLANQTRPESNLTSGSIPIVVTKSNVELQNTLPNITTSITSDNHHHWPLAIPTMPFLNNGYLNTC